MYSVSEPAGGSKGVVDVEVGVDHDAGTLVFSINGHRSAYEVELNVVSVVTLYDDNGDGMFDFDEFIKLVSDLLCLRDGVLFAPPQAGRNLAEVLAKQIPGPARPTIEVKHLVELDGRWASLIKQPDVVAAGGAGLRSFSDQRLHGDLDELNARRLALIPPSTIAEYKRELTRLGIRLPTGKLTKAAPAVPATQLSQEQARAVRAVLAVMCAVLLWGVSPTTHAMYAFVRSRVLAFTPYVAGTVAALQLAQWRWRSSQEQARAVLAVMCAVLLWGVSPNTHAMYAFMCDFVLALAPYVAITIVALFGAQLARWRWRATRWRANARWYVSSHGMLSFSLKVPRSRLCLAPLIRSADAGTSRSAATAGTSPAPAVGGRPSRASFGSPFGSMPFGSPAGQPANEAEALTKAKECDALRESLRKIADDFVAAPTEGAGVVDRRNLCGRYYTLAAAADAACGLRRASSDLPRLAWTDAFTGHEQPPTSSWGYELACALFNLAASLADLANGKPHKDAFKLYQQAAFTLDKLAEVSQQEGPWHGCEDLSGDTVSILSGLMLAQAQKALYLKIREENSAQPEMLEKLAAECASMFEEVSEQIRRTNKRPFRSFSSEWLAVIEANRLLLGGLAQQHAAKTHRINADAVFERVNEYGHQ
eukprot:jgi/Chrpa1/17610/Chrysochromulina_OHIO_Genome00022742-RA